MSNEIIMPFGGNRDQSNYFPELGPPKLSAEEEELRRKPAPELSQTSDKIGHVVRVYSLMDGKKPTHYVVLETDLGHRIPLHRVDAITRAYSILKMLLAETGGAEKGQMEKDIWLCHAVFKAAIENGRANGLKYKTMAIKRFEDQIRQVERQWRHVKDDVRTSKTRIRGFPGVGQEQTEEKIED